MRSLVAVYHTLWTYVLGCSGMADTRETRPSLTCFTVLKLVIICQTVQNMEIHRKKWILLSRLSRSLEVIWTDTDRSATY